MTAVREGDPARVRELAGKRPELVNSRDPDRFGCIPLRHAVVRGDRAMVDALLDLGADVNAKSDWWAGGFGVLPCPDQEMGEYLLTRGARLDAYGAAGMGWTDRLRRVLDLHPEQANMKGGDGQRPLHVAKTVEAVDLLVRRGADLEARDVDHGSTPVQYQINSAPVCRRLVEHGAQPDIFTACKLGDAGLAERVLRSDPDALDARIGRPPFVSEGSQGGHIYVYTIGAHSRPLELAHRGGHQALVDFLLERAAPRQKLLFFCWTVQRAPLAKLLAQHPDLASSLPAHAMAQISDAAWENRLESVRCMLEAGFDVDARGFEDSTPLDRAAFHGFSDLVELLLAHGASLEARNKYGGTPLGCCVYGSVHSWRKEGDHLRSAELLLGAGARPEKKWIPSGNRELDRLLGRFLDQ